MRFLIVLIIFISLVSCRKKKFTEDINQCDSIGNYYEDGVHFINRDFINDEGSLDYKKLFEKSEEVNHDCYPINTFK
jgi:hypothetical protein